MLGEGGAARRHSQGNFCCCCWCCWGRADAPEPVSIFNRINSQFSKSICTLSDVISQLLVPNCQFSKSIHNYCKMVYLKQKLKRKPLLLLLLLLLLWTLLEAFVSLGNLCFCLLWAPFGFECSAPVIRQEFDPGREEWEIDKAKAFGRTHDWNLTGQYGEGDLGISRVFGRLHPRDEMRIIIGKSNIRVWSKIISIFGFFFSSEKCKSGEKRSGANGDVCITFLFWTVCELLALQYQMQYQLQYQLQYQMQYQLQYQCVHYWPRRPISNLSISAQLLCRDLFRDDSNFSQMMQLI